MQIESIGEVVAGRALHRSADGGVQEVIIRIGKPQLLPGGEGHFCPVEIIGLGKPRFMYAGGVDSVQSLQLALRMISGRQHHHKRELAEGLWFQEPGDDPGFPEEAQTSRREWNAEI